MVIDSHVHLQTDPGYLDSLMETVDRMGIDRIVLFGAWPEFDRFASNDQILEAHQAYPQTIIPFYTFRLGEESPDVLERVRKDGFRGLKLINPPANYNDERFFPVWERCESLGLVTLFHTGIVSRNPQQVHYDLDTSRMKVIYLDRIARKFQKMTMFVAHLGNPDYGEACMMARWHANMYFDLSGSTLKKKSPDFFREMLWWGRQKIRYTDELGRGPWAKILYGTDVTPAEMEETRQDYLDLFDALELKEEQRAAVMGGTAAGLLGLKE